MVMIDNKEWVMGTSWVMHKWGDEGETCWGGWGHRGEESGRMAGPIRGVGKSDTP